MSHVNLQKSKIIEVVTAFSVPTEIINTIDEIDTKVGTPQFPQFYNVVMDDRMDVEDVNYFPGGDSIIIRMTVDYGEVENALYDMQQYLDSFIESYIQEGMKIIRDKRIQDVANEIRDS